MPISQFRMTVNVDDASLIEKLEAEPGIEVIPVASGFVTGPVGVVKDPTLVDVVIEVETPELAEGRVRQIVGEDAEIGTARRYLPDAAHHEGTK